MKAGFAVLIACATLFFGGISFACSDCADDYYNYYQTSCSDCGYQSGYSSCGDCGVDSCDCSDPYWKFNNCMSRDRYCEAFGNVGAR